MSDLIASKPKGIRPLSPEQTALVDTMVTKHVDHLRAAEILGKCKKWAWRTVQKEHVRQELRRRTEHKLLSLSNQAVDKVEQLLKANDESVQLRAARDILDRTGFRTENSDLTRVAATNVQINIDLS